MDILLNNIPTPLPSDYMTVEELVSWKNLNPNSTAIALNGTIVRKKNWKLTKLNELDRVNVISAAFGG